MGPLVGGALLEVFWWGSVFLINVPVMAALLVLGPRLLPKFRDPTAGRIDLASAVLSLAAVLSVIYGLKETAQDGFGTVAAGAIAAGVVIGAAFVRRQTQLEDPLIDLKLFRVPRFSVSVASNTLTGFVVFGTFLYVAQYLQLVVGLSPLEAGLWSLPSSLGVIAGSMLAPTIGRYVRPAFAVAGGLVLAAAGFGILTQVLGTSGLPPVVVGSVVFSLGLGPVFILATDLILGTAPPERAGAASAISETGAELGGALGIAILGSIGTAVYRSGVVDSIPDGIPAATAEGARDTLGGALAVAENLPADAAGVLLDAARGAFADGLHLVSLTGAVVALAIAALVATLLRDVERGTQEVPEPAAPDGAVCPAFAEC